MKKLLSLALAVAMIMSIAVVALAADLNAAPLIELKDTWKVSDKLAIVGIAANPSNDSIAAYYKYSSDNNVMTTTSGGAPVVSYGNKFYYPLMVDENTLAGDSDAVKSMTVKGTWEMGGDLVTGISIVKKKFISSPSTYGYFVEVSLASAPLETASQDLIGTIQVKKSSGTLKVAVAGKNYFDIDVNVPVVYDYISSVAADYASDMSIITKDPKLYDFERKYTDPLDGKSKLMHDFSDETEYEFTFEKIADARFTVDVSSQKKIILKATADFNATIAAQYPYANLDFFVGNGASFNKIGELFLPADPGSFIYGVTSSGLAVVNAEYDSYEEGFFIKTRTLGTYVISDVELDLATVTTPADGTVEAPVVTEPSITPAPGSNPTTGAAV